MTIPVVTLVPQGSCPEFCTLRVLNCWQARCPGAPANARLELDQKRQVTSLPSPEINRHNALAFTGLRWTTYAGSGICIQEGCKKEPGQERLF